MGSFISKNANPSPKVIDLKQMEADIIAVIDSDESMAEKRKEAEALAGDTSQVFSVYIATLDIQKLESMYNTSVYINGAVLEYKDFFVSPVGVSAKHSLVFHIILAAISIYKGNPTMFIVSPEFSENIKRIYTPGSESIGRCLAVLAARPDIIKEILEEKKTYEEYNKTA